ncbi:Transposase IS4 [Popillia japonica]|uniref:Transposase IS4 n=1 Tax=Popillia japonica TaxID=7064 RepID=A0AAW1IG49_POPJA
MRNTPFTGSEKIEVPFDTLNALPIDYYNLFISDEVIELLINETSKNATQYLPLNQIKRSSRMKELLINETSKNATQYLPLNQIKRSSRMKDWKDTTCPEMRTVLGIRLWMGCVRMP